MSTELQELEVDEDQALIEAISLFGAPLGGATTRPSVGGEALLLMSSMGGSSQAPARCCEGRWAKSLET